MADTKITALTALTAADPANDVIPIVDVSDTSMAASGTTKKISVNNILGASGTATLASATITGAATVGTTFAVGTVTPDIFARFYTRSIGFDSSGSTMLQINGTSYGGIDLGAAGVRTFGITSSASDANISTVTNIPMIFNINSSTKMTLNTAGNLAFPTGKGIDFSAVTGGTGTATANVLNDYEEGTWAIGLTFGGGNTGLTTSANTGRYTKVGRQVTVTGLLVLTSKGSSTGAADITGLPFTISNQNAAYSTASLRCNGVSYTGAFQAFGAVNTTLIGLEQISTLGAVTSLTDANFTNASSVIFTLTYTV